MADYLNSFGLILDIIGICLLFKFGLPPSSYREKQGFALLLESAPSEEEKEEQTRRYDQRSRWALALIVIGFVLQIASNHLTQLCELELSGRSSEGKASQPAQSPDRHAGCEI